MNRCLIIKFLVFLFCSSTFAQDWSQYDGAQYYPMPNKQDCVFPFEFNGNSYWDCTVANYENGEYPWCSLTKDYEGLLTYCYNFGNTTLQCQPSFQMPDGKVYDKCDYLTKTAKYKQCKTYDPVIKYRYCTDALASPYVKSVQRRKDCDSNYTKLAVDHTMCFGPSGYAKEVPLNSSEIKDVLAKHNQFRAAVPSRYMFKLYWDAELAKLAQAHSNLCVFEHDLAINRLSPLYNWKNGQNIVMSTEITTNPATLIDIMLGSEKGNFRYGQTCDNGEGSCLHYTQAMLSNLTRVGCGQTHCVYPDHIERYVTCNYIQSQYEDNYQTPYVKSDKSAVDCPSKNVGGLCDCGDKICAYDRDEYLEPNTCSCKTQRYKRSDERDAAVEAELNGNGGGEVGIRNGGPIPHSHSKRHIKTIQLKSVHKRSDDGDAANQAELDENGGGDVKIRNDGRVPHSHSKRHIKTIPINREH